MTPVWLLDWVGKSVVRDTKSEAAGKLEKEEEKEKTAKQRGWSLISERRKKKGGKKEKEEKLLTTRGVADEGRNRKKGKRRSSHSLSFGFYARALPLGFVSLFLLFSSISLRLRCFVPSVLNF